MKVGKEETESDKMSRGVTRGIVFVIDDDSGMRSLLSDVLTSFGYSVTAFPDATAALKVITANSQRIDAIISDLNMPKVSGLEFIDTLKKMNSKIPVILVTAFGNTGTAHLAREKGAFGYLSKPFPLLEIDTMIQKAMSMSGSSSSNPKA